MTASEMRIAAQNDGSVEHAAEVRRACRSTGKNVGSGVCSLFSGRKALLIIQ